MIRLEVLGKPIVRYEQTEAKLYAKAVALLAYLALEGRTNRRKIAEMLWAGAPDPLNNLSVTRGHILGELGEGALNSDFDSIALGADVWCDAIEWKNDSSQKSWSLYRGEFLRDLRLREWKRGLGEEFEEWVLETREQLIQTYFDKAAKLGIEAIKTGALKEAIQWFEIANTDQRQPHEDVTRFLMLVYVVLDQSELALKTFSKLQMALQTLERKPSRETLQIAEICQDNSSHAARVLLEELLPQKQQKTPFVGREHEIQNIIQSIPLVNEGKSWITLIQGEPGMGKTTCMNQLIVQLDPNKRTYLLAEGFGERGAPPWRAFDFIVRTLIRSRVTVVENLPIEYRTILARFLPDVLETNSLEPQQGDDRLLFHAIRHLLAHEERPTLLCLDDIQWVDETSLGLVLELLRKPPPRGIVVTATYRNTEVLASDALLYRILEWIEREHQGQIVDLNPLQGIAIEQLIQQFGNQPADSTWMQAQSGGNALYLVEMLRAGYTQAGKIPPTLERLILNRVNAIPQASAAAEVLAACAILGSGATLFEIKNVTEQSYEETVKAIGILRQAGLLQQTTVGVDFNHSLTREATIKNLNQEQQQLLHFQAGQTRAEYPELAAAHYWQAIELGKTRFSPEQIRTITNTFAEAGKTSLFRGDLLTGKNWYEKSFSQVNNPIERVDILMQRANVFQRILKYEEALADLNQANLIFEALDPIRQANLLNNYGLLLLTNFRDSKAGEKKAQEALCILADIKSIEATIIRADAHNNLGIAAYLSNDFEKAKISHQKTLEIRQLFENKTQIATSLQNLGLVYIKLEDKKAEKIFHDAMQICKEIGNFVGIAKNHCNLGWFYWIFKDFSSAELNFQKALEITQNWGFDFVSHIAYNNLGMVKFSQGDFLTARDYYLKAENLPQILHSYPIRAQFLANAVEAELRLGWLEAAQEHLNTAFQLIENQSNLEQQPTLHWYQGELFSLKNDFQSACFHYYECIRSARIHKRVDREADAAGRLARIEKNKNLADLALRLKENFISKASWLVTHGRTQQALKEIRHTKDIYEEARFLLDISKGNNHQIIQQARLLLDQLSMSTVKGF